MTIEEKAEKLVSIVPGLVSKLLYYDRKDSEYLSPEDVEDILKSDLRFSVLAEIKEVFCNEMDKVF